MFGLAYTRYKYLLKDKKEIEGEGFQREREEREIGEGRRGREGRGGEEREGGKGGRPLEQGDASNPHWDVPWLASGIHLPCGDMEQLRACLNVLCNSQVQVRTDIGP